MPGKPHYPPGGIAPGERREDMKSELKDLFKAIRNERIFVLRFHNMKDRDTMLDHRYYALQIIREFEEEFELSDSMKRFLVHRICAASKDTGLM